MSIISIDPEATLEAARHLVDLAQLIQDYLDSTHQSVDGMYAAGNAGHYMAAFEQDSSYFRQQALSAQSTLEALAHQLQATVAMFTETDVTSAGFFDGGEALPQTGPHQTGPTFDPRDAEGEKYLAAAQAAGIDPILFGMIIKNEWNHRAYENVIPFFMTQLDSDFSYGVGQIQGATAVTVITSDPERFPEDEYPQLYIDGALSQDRVEWELFVNEEFNLAVASYYVADIQQNFSDSLVQMGLRVSDVPVAGSIMITQEQYDQMTAIMYRQGPDRIINNLLTLYQTPEDRYEAIVNTISAESVHVNNVFSNREHVENVLGVEYDHEQDE